MAVSQSDSINVILADGDRTIAVVEQNGEIQGLLAAIGFAGDKMVEGRRIYNEANQARLIKEAAAGAKIATGTAAAAALDTACIAYQDFAKTLRAFIKEPGLLRTLGLTGKMPRRVDAFLQTAQTLFGNAIGNPEIMKVLAGIGYNDERLRAEQAKLTSLRDAEIAKQQANGAAQQATDDQNAAVKSLKVWIAQLRKMARIALRTRPQLLEALGILVTERKRAAKPQEKPGA